MRSFSLTPDTEQAKDANGASRLRDGVSLRGATPPKTVEVGAYSLKKLQKTGTFRPDRTLKVHGSGVQKTVPAKLPPGEYVLEVSIKGQQYDASYYFRIVVE